MSTSPFAANEPNPYQSPIATHGEVPVATGTKPTVTTRTVEMLAQTKPWVRFLSILGFISAGLMVVGGLFLVLGSAVAGNAQLIVLGVVYPLMGLLYIVPSMHLYRYASRIGDLLYSRSSQNLEDALEAQKSFWRFMGILCAIVLALYAVIIVFFILGGFLSGALSRIL